MEKKPLERSFSRWFWIGVIVLVMITVSLYVIGNLYTDDKALKEAKKVQVISERSLQKISPIVSKAYRNLNFMDYPQEFKQQLSDAVDEAFLPVYGNIPKFADMHYSVKGGYAELLAYAKGDLAKTIQDILFERFDEEKLSSQINQHLTGSLTFMVRQSAQKEADGAHIPEEERQAINQIIDATIQKQVLNFRTAGLLGFGAAGGTGVIKTVSGTGGIISKRFLQKMTAKYLTKLASKKVFSGVVASAGAGAATGASVGSVIPGLGTIVFGLGGAVVGWLAADSVFVAADEYLSRDEFEKNLADLVTEQKDQLKKDLMQQMNLIKARLSASGQEWIQGKSPAEILEMKQ